MGAGIGEIPKDLTNMDMASLKLIDCEATLKQERRDRRVYYIPLFMTGALVGASIMSLADNNITSTAGTKKIQRNSNEVRVELERTFPSGIKDLILDPSDHSVTVKVDSKLGPEVCEGNYTASDNGHAKIVGDLACTRNVAVTAGN